MASRSERSSPQPEYSRRAGLADRTYATRAVSACGSFEEEFGPHGRPIDVPVSPYSHERLAHLLRLLGPAPLRWITRAQRSATDSTALTDRHLAELEWKLESDASFRERFDADPVAAAEAIGMRQLARALDHEIRELVGLAERIANDPEYRTALESDPVTALRGEDVSATIAEPLLRALAFGEDAVAKLPEVVAHEYEPLSRTARLRLLLLGSAAVVTAIRTRSESV